MHIGFDISQTGSGKAGCGYFAHALIKAMLELAPEHCYSLFPSFGDFYFDALMPVLSPYSGRETRYGPRHLSRETLRKFWSAEGVETSMGNPDVLHANNFWCPTQLVSSRLIYTFYDMGFVVNPSWTTEANRVGCFDGVFRSAIAADWVVAISEASRAHYLHIFPHFPPDRVRVIHPCSRFNDGMLDKRPAALEKVAPGRFWLSVGTIEPRKNQRRLAEAYANYLNLGGEPMPLVFAGGKGWLMEDFVQHIRALGIESQVVMAGYVSDEELAWLYRNCYVNLCPSLFEGFGLPVLEGMQFGAATVASDNSSLPEVAGSAAVLLNAEDVNAWTQSMLRLAREPDERQRMRGSATERAKQFEWRLSARALLELYAEAASSPKRNQDT